MTPWYVCPTRELHKQLWQSKAENSRWERNMGRTRKCSGCFREQKQWNSKITKRPKMTVMHLTGRITLGSCLLYGCLAHLTNFGSIWVLPSVSCMSSVCKAASLSASPCSWQKLQIGALCTTKERLSFLCECTKCLALGILRHSEGSLNHVHDHQSSFEHQENAGLQVWLEAERVRGFLSDSQPAGLLWALLLSLAFWSEVLDL